MGRHGGHSNDKYPDMELIRDIRVAPKRNRWADALGVVKGEIDNYNQQQEARRLLDYKTQAELERQRQADIAAKEREQMQQTGQTERQTMSDTSAMTREEKRIAAEKEMAGTRFGQEKSLLDYRQGLDKKKELDDEAKATKSIIEGTNADFVDAVKAEPEKYKNISSLDALDVNYKTSQDKVKEQLAKGEITQWQAGQRLLFLKQGYTQKLDHLQKVEEKKVVRGDKVADAVAVKTAENQLPPSEKDMQEMFIKDVVAQTQGIPFAEWKQTKFGNSATTTVPPDAQGNTTTTGAVPPQIPEGAIRTNKKTGVSEVFKGGAWVKQ